MKIYIREGGLLVPENKKEKNILRDVSDLFSISNPKFIKNLAQNFSTWDIPAKLNFYTNTPNGLLIPIGGINAAIQYLLANSIRITPLNLTDFRQLHTSPDFFSKVKFKGELRDYQEEIDKSMEGHTTGVIAAKTGSGKTVSFVYRTLKHDYNTLILTHTKELANQTRDAFVQFSNLKKSDIGFIGSGKFIKKPITISLLQTLNRLPDSKIKEMNDFFSQIITDETHIIAATTYYNSISSLAAKYKFGFSATPEREDGLTKVIHWATGSLIHKVPDRAVAHKLIIPEYKQVKTNFYFPYFDSSEYQTMLNFQAENEERNKQIVEEFNKNPDKPSVFLCSRISQVEILHKMIPNSIMLTSKMSKAEREQAMEDLLNKKKQNVVTTWGLFSEGINVPHLEYLYAVGPMSSKIKLKQAAGRLMRQAEGKTSAYIIDFVDIKVGVFAGQAKKRRRILTNL